MSQGGHRVLRRAANALGQHETAAGALLHPVVRRHVADRHRRGRPGQPSGRVARRRHRVGGAPGTGHGHANVRGFLRGAQAVGWPPVDETADAAARVHRRRFRDDAVYSAVDFGGVTRLTKCIRFNHTQISNFMLFIIVINLYETTEPRGVDVESIFFI